MNLKPQIIKQTEQYSYFAEHLNQENEFIINSFSLYHEIVQSEYYKLLTDYSHLIHELKLAEEKIDSLDLDHATKLLVQILELLGKLTGMPSIVPKLTETNLRDFIQYLIKPLLRELIEILEISNQDKVKFLNYCYIRRMFYLDNLEKEHIDHTTALFIINHVANIFQGVPKMKNNDDSIRVYKFVFAAEKAYLHDVGLEAQLSDELPSLYRKLFKFLGIEDGRTFKLVLTDKPIVEPSFFRELDIDDSDVQKTIPLEEIAASLGNEHLVNIKNNSGVIYLSPGQVLFFQPTINWVMNGNLYRARSRAKCIYRIHGKSISNIFHGRSLTDQKGNELIWVNTNNTLSRIKHFALIEMLHSSDFITNGISKIREHFSDKDKAYTIAIEFQLNALNEALTHYLISLFLRDQTGSDVLEIRYYDKSIVDKIKSYQDLLGGVDKLVNLWNSDALGFFDYIFSSTE